MTFINYRDYGDVGDFVEVLETVLVPRHYQLNGTIHSEGFLIKKKEIGIIIDVNISGQVKIEFNKVRLVVIGFRYQTKFKIKKNNNLIIEKRHHISKFYPKRSLK